jgi:hypothetical protein
MKKAMENLIINGGNKGKALKDAGYSDATAKNPKLVLESKGFMELCDQYGLTEELILTALVEDIQGKPKNRKAELELAAKIRKMTTDKVETDVSGNINVNIIKFAD